MEERNIDLWFEKNGGMSERWNEKHRKILLKLSALIKLSGKLQENIINIYGIRVSTRGTKKQ